MAIKVRYLILLIIAYFNCNLFGMDVAAPNFTWATATSSRTLELMAHSGLHRLVPRGLLMDKYGLPIVAGSSVTLGAFDSRNDTALSGNIMTTPGAYFDLFKIGGMCGSRDRQDIINSLINMLNNIEQMPEVNNPGHACTLLKQLRKIEFSDNRAVFPKIEALSPEAAGVQAEAIYWNPDEFFANEDERPSFPIAFASTTIWREMKAAVGSGCKYEHLVGKELSLGQSKDIQYILVAQENIEYINSLLNKMFPEGIDKPNILSFEQIRNSLQAQVINILSKIPGDWLKYLTKEQEEKPSFDQIFALLPAFLSKDDPLVLSCLSGNLLKTIEDLQYSGLKPVHISSPLGYSLYFNSPSSDESNANLWLEGLQKTSTGLKLPNGLEINEHNILIEVEVGL